jgi:PAS domain S-box-containing protein
MAIPLRALIVEDSENDTLLLARELKRGGYDLTYKRVDTFDTMKAELDKQWDIVFADYSMPHLRGTDALLLLRERDSDTPFIYVSGTIGEDMAVAAMKAGANDYIIKTNLSRLASVLARELEEAEIRAAHRVAQQDLVQSKLRYQEMFSANPHPMWVYDPETLRFLSVNDAAVAHYGWSREEFSAMTIADIRPAGEVQRTLAQVARVGHQKIAEAEMWKHRKKDGAIIDVEVGSHVIDFDGQRARVVLAHDVTHRLAVERKLRESEAGLRRAQDLARLAHIITGPKGSFESWSENLPQLIGVDEAGIPRGTREWLEMVHSEDRALFRQKCIDAGVKGTRTEVAYRLLRPDGEWIHVQQTMEPLGRDSGTDGMPRWFNTMQDVTKQRQAEGEIQRLNAELEQRVEQRTAELKAANSELEAFSYSVSHDLRAPLRHIDGFAQMLREQCAAALDASGRRYLGVITESVKQMGELIDDLLQFSKMGRVEMHQTQVSTDDLVREVVKTLEGEIRNRSIEWDIEPLPDVRGDRSMLRQVWVNLLSNSVKYTRSRPLAKIKIGYSKAAGEFNVQDNGAGFEMAYAGKLFGVFQRLHRAEEFEGTGVGLASVQRIITRHGGRIRGQGKVDEGATFHFSLPIHQGGHP